MKSIDINNENIKGYDCVVIGTDHADFDYEMIRKNAKLIVDTRGIYRGKHENIVSA